MHIDITPENLLIQLGYPVNSALLSQAESSISATHNFDAFSKHLLSLKDEIAHLNGYIALSNSKNAIKIKSDATSDEEIEAYISILTKWSEKYKVELERVKESNTFYILGQK